MLWVPILPKTSNFPPKLWPLDHLHVYVHNTNVQLFSSTYMYMYMCLYIISYWYDCTSAISFTCTHIYVDTVPSGHPMPDPKKKLISRPLQRYMYICTCTLQVTLYVCCYILYMYTCTCLLHDFMPLE